ncbi:lymphocyte antigen 75-like, partial [Notothenia coriiceps]|uniref:Lymphocyte antigen 75-like n=1 Tax=Notothenia coriiceps TaxID=8208 RepID=A0A6I9PHK0_9TELE
SSLSNVTPVEPHLKSRQHHHRIHIPERLDSAEILIGNSLENNGGNNPSCAVVTSIPSGGTHTFECGGMIGRLVRISLNRPNSVLTLCEVEVYGELAAPSPSFSAVVSGRGIVVVEKKLCWSDALFYCRDFYWDLLSIRSKGEQKEVEEVLRNASFPLTQHVWMGLRRYLMDSIWFWMSGASVNYSYWKTHSPLQISSPCGGVDTSDPFHWTDVPCGDHLYFICLTDVQEEVKRVTFYSSTRP